MNRNYLTIYTLIGLIIISSYSIYSIFAKEITGRENSNNRAIMSEKLVKIRNEEEFQQFAEDVNNGNTYAGQQVELTADLDFHLVTDAVSVGIADSENRFQGVFNGNGHKIENLDIKIPDGEAGLFVNLGGIVCNLKVVSGTVTGLISGGVASSVTDTGVIANCSNAATVTGKTAGEMAGVSKGTIINCVALGTGSTAIVGEKSYGKVTDCYNRSNAIILELNDNLARLRNLYPINNWEQWKMNESVPELTEQKASLLYTSTIQIMLSNKKQSIVSYFSELENAWCFAIPEGTENQKRILDLEFTSNISDTLEIPMDQDVYFYEKEGIHYVFKFLINDSVPSIFVNTESEKDGLAYLEADKKNKLTGDMTVLSEHGATKYTGMLDFITGRGNDSWSAAKKGFNLKLEKAEDLLGMGTDKDYVLLPGYRDNSLLSYKMIQDMEKQMQIAYAPESRLVNLYMDGNYLGLYLLTEKIEIGKNRFAIKNLYKETKKKNANSLSHFKQKTWSNAATKAERVWYDIPNEPLDYTGGYLLELDVEDYDEKQSRFVSDNGTNITLKSNTYATKRQVDYIADLWQDFEDAVSSKYGYNKKGIYYADYIDMESFADQWLMFELNEDASMIGSIYFYKDSDLIGDGRIYAGYAWDVEHSFTEEKNRTKSWIMGRMQEELKESAPYWTLLYQHEDFAQRVYQEWKNKYLPALEILLDTTEENQSENLCSITEYERLYTYAAAINSTKWKECNWWDKGEHIRIFLTERMQFLEKSLQAYHMGYDYYGEEDGIFYGYYYASDNETEDRREVIH